MVSNTLPKHLLVSSILVLFFFFPLFWISQYNYPSGDDFGMALLARKLGVLGATEWWYFNYCGRYSYSFLQSLVSSYENWLTIYKIFPVALILAGFGCVYYFIRAFFGRGFSGAELLTLSASVYVLLVSLTPDITTGFYWLSSNIQYSGAVFTSLLIFAICINLSRAQTTPVKTAYALLVIVLITLLAGLNEASALFFIATLGTINFFYILRFKRPDKWNLAFLVISVTFGLISFLAPGTEVRVRELEAEFDFLNILVGSIALTFFLLVEILTSTPLLLASIIYLAFLNFNRGKLDRPRSLLLGVRWYWVLSAMLLTITAVNSAVLTAIGLNSLTDRLKNAYVYSIFFGWLLLMTTLFFDLSAKKINLHVPNWIIGALAAFIFGFLFTGYQLEISLKNVIPSSSGSQRIFSVINTKSVYSNAYLDILSGRAARFSRQNREREEQLLNAEGDTVDFSLYSYVPETIFVQDVNHPFGAPDSLSTIICGKVKTLRLVETGPPAPVKKKF